MNIYVLDKSFRVLSILDNYESLLWNERYWECGDFEIYTPVESPLLEVVKLGYYLVSTESERGMIIEGFKTNTDANNGDHLTVTGRSLESMLDRRIVWTQTTVSGNLQNAIEKLLNDAIISPANADRKITNFVFKRSEDPAITSITITDAQYTGDNLYDVISGLCKLSGIGFKIILTDDNKFEFSLFKGADRSYNQVANPYVIFSPKFENLISSDYKENEKTYKNVALVAGEGEGTDRTTSAIGSGSGLERKELYVDARDISSTDGESIISPTQYKSLLEQRGKEKLEDYKIEKEFKSSADTSNIFVYRKDFDIGDIVQVQDGYGHEAHSRIVEMITSHTNTGFKIYPTFEDVED